MMEISTNFDDIKKGENLNISYLVKSNSVIKSSTLGSPIKFVVLNNGADIKSVPNNWLSTTEGKYALEHALYQTKGFDRIAKQVPECLGDVDFISNSENIKKLLNLVDLPNTVISMLVHRVGNSLLLDEIDTNNCLLSNDDSWFQLKKFIFEKSSLDDLLSLDIPKQYLLPEFIYKSIEPHNTKNVPYRKNSKSKPKLNKGILPEPKLENAVPYYTTSHPSIRHVVWSFEGFRMLLGTNMHIFENSNYPKTSLRLNDLSKPFGATTGKEYWFDNLMSNVPELLICNHLKGFVQNYELVKTEDIPCLQNSSFSPRLNGVAARSILSRLQKLIMEPGHTYWLFKGKNDDKLKLYNLTTSCSNQDNQDTPFRVPIALMQYIAANNLLKKFGSTMGDEEMETIEELLRDCIKVLPKDSYPEILASAHLMLSELYIPFEITAQQNYSLDILSDDTNIDEKLDSNISLKSRNSKSFDGTFKKLENESLKFTKNDENYENDENDFLSVTVDDLFQKHSYIERCEHAIVAIHDGINYLKHFTTTTENKLLYSEEEAKKHGFYKLQLSNIEKMFANLQLPEQQQNQCKSVASFENNINNFFNAINSKTFGSWSQYLKILLIQNAYLAYITIGELELKSNNFGESLRAFNIAFRCHQIVIKHLESVEVKNCYLFVRAANCYYGIYKYVDNIEEYIDGYNYSYVHDVTTLEPINEEIHKNVDEVIIKPMNNVQIVMSSCDCLFECALAMASPQQRIEILPSFGIVLNDFSIQLLITAQGAYDVYMDTYSEELEGQNPNEESYQMLASQSFSYLTRSDSYFKEVNDTVKQALIHANIANYMVFRGNVHFKGEMPIKTSHFFKFYNEAVTLFNRAIALIDTKQKSPQLWDSIHWDLTCIKFAMFQKGIDHPELAADYFDPNLHKETLELLHNWLANCKWKNDDSEETKYFYKLRQGIIHQRIGLLHYAKVRAYFESPTALKRCAQLCQSHFEKSVTFFQEIRTFNDILCVQIDRVILQEFLAFSSQNKGSQIKYLRASLDVCLQCKSIIFDWINTNTDLTIDFLHNITRFQHRLQYTLKFILKLTFSANSKENGPGSIYKKMYHHTLNATKYTDAVAFSKHMSEILKKLIEINKEIK